MKFLFAIAFLCLVICILIIFKVDTKSISDTLNNMQKKKPTLKKLSLKKKQGKIKTSFNNIVLALDTMGQIGSLYRIILISFLLIIMGAFAGFTFGNIYLSIVFAIILASIPFIYVRIQYIEYKALLIDEMEVALSVITSSIERTENIITAFEENVDNIGKPLQTVFLKFIYSVNHNIPMEQAIDEMKTKITHSVFIDWCDNLKRVHKDRSLISSLRPIVDRITNIKIATGEAKNILSEATSEFISVTVLSVVFMILSYLVIPNLLSSVDVPVKPAGWIKIVFAIDIFTLYFFSVRTFTLTKNINFEDV